MESTNNSHLFIYSTSGAGENDEDSNNEEGREGNVEKKIMNVFFPSSQLTYDYKFDYEDDDHKISCLCGAPNCRKWMN